MNIANGEKYSFILKCTTNSRAEKMLKYGELYFSHPKIWAGLSNKGQGDRYEGVFATLHQNDKESLKRYKAKYKNDLIIEKENQLLLLKLKSVSNMPTFCYYSLKNKNYIISDTLQEGTIHISGKYFSDFKYTDSEEDLNEIAYDDRPCFVLIQNPDLFLKNIKLELKSLGVNPNEVFEYNIKYKNIWNKYNYRTKEKHPEELSFKDTYFKYQEETRIVIGNGKSFIHESQKGVCIKIGNMESYAKKIEGYHKDGLKVQSKLRCTTIY